MVMDTEVVRDEDPELTVIVEEMQPLTVTCSRNDTDPNDIVLRLNGNDEARATYEAPGTFTISRISSADHNVVVQCTFNESGSNVKIIKVAPPGNESTYM